MVTPLALALRKNRRELALLRGKRTPGALEGWIKAFGAGDRSRAERYALAVARFLGDESDEGAAYIGRLSPNTRRSYAFAITEFFEWAAAKHGRVVAPHEVTRKDAEDYADWLATKPFSLRDEVLRDGDQPERLAIFEAVRAQQPTKLPQIAKALPEPLRSNRARLSHHLGRMVLHDLLVRSPTLEELRAEDPRIGINVFHVQIPGKKGEWRTVPLDDIYEYRLVEPRPVGRTTVVQRLSALVSFWDVLMEGENAPGGEPLLRYNVFRPVRKRASRGLAQERRAASQRENQLTADLVRRLLEAGSEGAGLVDRRDEALVWFLLLTGARVSEAVRLRRQEPPASDRGRYPGWLDATSEPPTVVLFRKGGKRQVLPYPPYALRALHDFHAALKERAAPMNAQSTDSDGENYLPPTSSAWRYRELLEQPDAPLFPPVELWGANSAGNYEELKPNVGLSYQRGLTRHGVTRMLQRLAQKAGLSEADRRKVHAHAIRHYAATAMERGGKPLREIQAILGHTSITTTESYLREVDDISALSGQSEILRDLAVEPAEAEEPVEAETPPKVVRAVGVEVPEEPTPEPLAIEPEHTVAEAPPVEEPAAIVHETPEGALVSIAGEEPPTVGIETRDGMSPGSPFEVYEALAEENPVETIRFRKGPKKRDEFLDKHYPKIPEHFGLGNASLLPWFARGTATADGRVVVSIPDPENPTKQKSVTVPPIPVLSPDQAYPETTERHALLAGLEALYERWVAVEPTRTYGLLRWYAVLAHTTAKLEKLTERSYTWVPFDGVGRVGEDIRAHDDDWLLSWFEHNAHTYLTTVRAFKVVPRPRRRRDDDEFSLAFMFAAHEGLSPAHEIPQWFMDEDPVHAIYERDPDEWNDFVTWLASVTGQKITKERDQDRKSQEKFADQRHRERIDDAKAQLETYYSLRSAMQDAIGEGDDEASERYRVLIEGGKLEGREVEGVVEILAKLGVPDPAEMEEEHELPRELEKRPEAIVRLVFADSEEPALSDPNVFRSELFDEDAFRIDTRRHTIVHTPEFRADFARRFDGRDSECVVRRAARAMWEYVRHAEKSDKERRKVKEQQSMLYSILLSYVAWIVPCPEDIERRVPGALEARTDKREYLARVNEAIRDLMLGAPDQTAEEMLAEGRARGMTEDELRTAIDVSLFAASQFAEAREGEPEAQLGELLSPEGAFRVHKMGAGPMRKNPGLVVSSADDETMPAALIRCGEQPRLLMTPNAHRRAASLVENARRVLPSPLRMVAAMTITP